ncbi:MAG: extracellular solute-binding protein [Thermoflexales bacterium]|nr:extracellular solute-binding protein [Thermoflexales bacterium]
MNAPSLKALALLITAVILLSLVAACGAPASTPVPPTAVPSTQAAEPTKAAEPVELRMAWWGSQDRHDRTIKAIELYEKQHPNVKITYEFSGWNDYWTKLTTMAAGGNLPDIMQQDYAYISDWTNRGLLAPLDDYAKSGVLNFADVSPSYLDGGRVNGNLMGVNIGANSMAIALDVDAFKAAGVDLPAGNWTLADYEKIAMALHDKLNILGDGASLWDEQHWGALYLSAGTWRYAPDGAALGYADDKVLADYFAMLLRLIKAGAIPSRDVELSEYDTLTKGIEVQPMITGKAAMSYVWSNQIIAVWKAAGDTRNFVMVPLPRVVGGKSANYLKPGQFLSVTSHSKHPKEATAFIDWFTNSVECNEILMAERGVPVSSKVRDALKPQLGKSQLEMFNYIDRVGKDVQPVPPADPPGHTDIVKNVWYPQVVDPVAYGKITPEEGVATLREQATTILAKNKK